MYHRRFVEASRRVLGRITTTTTTTKKKKKQDRPSLSYFQLQSASTISSTAAPTTEATKATEAAKLIQTFQSIVASSTIRGINIFSAVQEQNVLNGCVESSTTAAYLKGQRLGAGTALAIVRPTTLAQVPQIVQAAIEANCTIIVQGANTGLTGSSVPNETEKDDRPTVIISMKHLTCIQPVDDGTKVLCYAGVGLGSLQSYVETNCGTGRMSHSVLGSTFLNPTTAAGESFRYSYCYCYCCGAYFQFLMYSFFATVVVMSSCILNTNYITMNYFMNSCLFLGHRCRIWFGWDTNSEGTVHHRTCVVSQSCR